MKKFLKIFAILLGFASLMTFTSCIMGTKAVVGHNVKIINDLDQGQKVEVYYYKGAIWEDELAHKEIPSGDTVSININYFYDVIVFYDGEKNGDPQTFYEILSEGPYVSKIKLSKLEFMNYGSIVTDRESYVTSRHNPIF